MRTDLRGLLVFLLLFVTFFLFACTESSINPVDDPTNIQVLIQTKDSVLHAGLSNELILSIPLFHLVNFGYCVF